MVNISRRMTDRFGGNGGLSLRRVSRVKEVLAFQKREHNSASEDQWLSSRVGLVPGAHMASPEVGQHFAVEDIWADRPMGYHINPTMGPGASSAEVWELQNRRKAIFEYCPEIKIVLDMRLERERCLEPPPSLQEPDAAGLSGSVLDGSVLDNGEQSQRGVPVPEANEYWGDAFGFPAKGPGGGQLDQRIEDGDGKTVMEQR